MSVTTPNIRYGSKGQRIESNWAVTSVGPSTYRCDGCGREFGAHDGTYNPYSWAVDWPRYYALNKARAERHADRCKGDGSWRDA